VNVYEASCAKSRALYVVDARSAAQCSGCFARDRRATKGMSNNKACITRRRMNVFALACVLAIAAVGWGTMHEVLLVFL